MVSSSSLIMCSADSDWSSDLTQASSQLSCADCPSWTGCSLPEQIQYYRNKLLSTMQILDHKDEMIKVQIESLQIAEVRISTITARNAQLQAELDKRNNEIKLLHHNLEVKTNGSSKSHAKKGSEVTITKLQNNLSVIENLYRDCFYELAKREEMVELLRNSFLEIRQTTTEKSDEICRLQSTVLSQKWDLEKCQTIAEELENLKSDIANFLNNPNNDSGMWERSEDSLPNDICQELSEITEQLLQLKDILDTDCSCGLLQENRTLKSTNGQLNTQLAEVNSRIKDLQNIVTKADETMKRYKDKIQENSSEMLRLADTIRESERCREELLREKEQLLRDRKELNDRESVLKREVQEARLAACGDCTKLQEVVQEAVAARKSIDGLKEKLKACKFEIKCKTTDLERWRSLGQTHECTIRTLKEQLNSTKTHTIENVKLRSEVSYLNSQLAVWQTKLSESTRRVLDMEHQQAATRRAYEELQSSFKNKTESAAWLERELAEASSRGAELCAESRHMVSGVRHWIQHMRQQHQQQKATIQALQRRLKEVRLRLAEYEGGLSDGCYNVFKVTSAKCDDFCKSRCSMERVFAECDSSGGGGGAGSSGVRTTCSPSPSPSPPSPLRVRRTSCRSCDAARAGTSRENSMSPSEELMNTMENAGNRFHSPSSRVSKKMKSFFSARDQE